MSSSSTGAFAACGGATAGLGVGGAGSCFFTTVGVMVDEVLLLREGGVDEEERPPFFFFLLFDFFFCSVLLSTACRAESIALAQSLAVA